MSSRRYDRDVLSAPKTRRVEVVEVAVEPGLRITHRGSGFAGTVTRVGAQSVVLRDATGTERTFRLAPGGFLCDGRPATLVRRVRPDAGPVRTASGSFRAEDRTAKVARASRVWVEGVHDAELLEKVWGDDLRDEGIVVEPLHGADDLAAAVRAFAPGPQRRLGVLLDHLVAGSKEHRIARTVQSDHVLVAGHPYVDVWAGVRPRTLGLDAWPQVARGQPWKEGVCAALGAEDPPRFWRRLLRSVSGYVDLEQPLVGAVEQLIDFVAGPPADT
jgi:Protein of unknown function (DUF3097)